MNLINAISNPHLGCSKVQVQIKLPWVSCTIPAWFWTAKQNPTNDEKPFCSPHTSKANCANMINTKLYFSRAVSPPNSCRVVQDEPSFSSRCLWSPVVKRSAAAISCCCACTAGKHWQATKTIYFQLGFLKTIQKLSHLWTIGGHFCAQALQEAVDSLAAVLFVVAVMCNMESSWALRH